MTDFQFLILDPGRAGITGLNHHTSYLTPLDGLSQRLSVMILNTLLLTSVSHG